MLVSWMLYVVLFTALAGVGALALDHVAGIWQLPRRGIWFAAVVLSVVVPVRIAVHGAPTVQPIHIVDRGDAVRVSPTTVAMIARAAARARAETAAWRPGPVENAVALQLWIALSLLLALLLLQASLGLARRRRCWRTTVIDGVRVFVADDVGPAVVGFLRPAIVLPQWAIDTPASDRTLMLRHECEHVTADDPRLLGIAALALVLCPFDLPLWWIVRRLRLAIELDCDRRVLRAVARPRDYGLLLIAVGARRRRLVPLAAPLAEQRPFLERRIRAMTAVRPSRPLIATLPFAAIALVAAVAAAQVPTSPLRPAAAPTTAVAAAVVTHDSSDAIGAVRAQPARATVVSAARATQANPSESTRAARASGASGAVRASASLSTTRAAQPMIPVSEIRALIAEHHPGVIAGDTSANVVTIVLDANKRYVQSVAQHAPETRTVVSSAKGRGQLIHIDSVGNGEMRSAFIRGDGQDTIVVSGNVELLSGLSIQENQVAAEAFLSLPPKVIGPNLLRVVLLQLKPAR